MYLYEISQEANWKVKKPSSNIIIHVLCTFDYRKYNYEKTTQNLNVPYFVKKDFNTEYRGSLRRLEQQIEDDYISTLRTTCYRERTNSKYLWYCVPL